MRRKTALIIGIGMTAATGILLWYAAVKVTEWYSFDRESGSATVDPGAGARNLALFDEITLAWDSIPNASTYNLYWSTRPGVTRSTGKKIPGVTPPYRFTRIEKGRTYYFVVTAVIGGIESSESEEIIYKTDP